MDYSMYSLDNDLCQLFTYFLAFWGLICLAKLAQTVKQQK